MASANAAICARFSIGIGGGAAGWACPTLPARSWTRALSERSACDSSTAIPVTRASLAPSTA